MKNMTNFIQQKKKEFEEKITFANFTWNERKFAELQCRRMRRYFLTSLSQARLNALEELEKGLSEKGDTKVKEYQEYKEGFIEALCPHCNKHFNIKL